MGWGLWRGDKKLGCPRKVSIAINPTSDSKISRTPFACYSRRSLEKQGFRVSESQDLTEEGKYLTRKFEKVQNETLNLILSPIEPPT